MADLTSNVLAFCSLLRTAHGFDIGHAQAHEALRAVERVGIRDSERVRYAMRLVCCTRPEHIEIFDEAFDAFFGNRAPGAPQPRPPRAQAGEEDAQAPPGTQREIQTEKTPAQAWEVMRARYSPAAAQTQTAPAVPDAGLAETLADAGRLIASLHLGRSRRWKPHLRGKRFDLRRTLRSSLQTGGDPLHIRTLGHPLRNPRIVVLLDASRSMADHALQLLQFAYALCRRSNRTSVFVFSTGLREVTRELRFMVHEGDRTLEPLGAAWGGGTRIGACLKEFVRSAASRLNADTLVIIASDGLDTGEAGQLESAMREIYRRCAGIFWLNPHAGLPGFTPAARGMQTALPYVSALLDARDLQSLGAAARYLRR